VLSRSRSLLSLSLRMKSASDEAPPCDGAEGASSILGFLGAYSSSEFSSSYSSRSMRSRLRSRRREARRSCFSSWARASAVEGEDISLWIVRGWFAVLLTSDIASAVGKLLDFFFGEDAEDDDEVLTLLEALVGLFEGFRVDETTVDLGPARSRWDAFLMRL